MNAQPSDEEIQRAVAEEMGWDMFSNVDIGFDPTLVADLWPEQEEQGCKAVPDFHLSLDACTEFEKDAPEEYWYALFRLVHPNWERVNDRQLDLCWMAVARATPRQRCIAFLTWKGRIK